jgi:hypothetical protein
MEVIAEQLSCLSCLYTRNLADRAAKKSSKTAGEREKRRRRSGVKKKLLLSSSRSLPNTIPASSSMHLVAWSNGMEQRHQITTESPTMPRTVLFRLFTLLTYCGLPLWLLTLLLPHPFSHSYARTLAASFPLCRHPLQTGNQNSRLQQKQPYIPSFLFAKPAVAASGPAASGPVPDATPID